MMSQKRSMPSKKKVYEYWQHKFNKIYNKDIQKDCCFACGFNAPILQRCHILSKVDGGSDKANNLHLLCRFCHIESEFFSGESYSVWIKNKTDSLEMEMHLNVMKHYYRLKSLGLKQLIPSDILKQIES